jgi:hypothetical protein
MSDESSQREQDENGKKEVTEPRVDEGWKESVAEERDRLKEQHEARAEEEGHAEELPEPEFRVFVAGLYTQTLMALGEVANPLTHKTEKNLREAQYLVDTIDMLKQKTQGNLSPEEDSYLVSLLHDLRMRYVTVAKQQGDEKQTESE